MHEMALAEGVREIVEETARRHGAARVRSVRLEIGRLAPVDAAALRLAFEFVKRGSVADSARLDVVEDEGSAWCMRCCESVAIAARGEPCPKCAHYQLQITGGEGMRVLDVEIA